MSFQLAVSALSIAVGLASSSPAVAAEQAVSIQIDSGVLHGTLPLPSGDAKVPDVLIIAGSGPTDRDGNQSNMKNNSLRLLAAELSNRGIASLRFDKRGVARSGPATVREENLRFDIFVRDAERWARFLADVPTISRLVLVGHSEGALVGTLAAQEVQVAGLVSIAGAGTRASELIRAQLEKSEMPSRLRSTAELILEWLRRGRRVEKVPSTLNSLFRPSIQPYLMSWFKFDPVVELAQLSTPVLVVQGTNDLQIDITNALKLKSAGPHVRMAWIPEMNHVLKSAPCERSSNFATYTNPDLPLADGLIEAIARFVLQLGT